MIHRLRLKSSFWHHAAAAVSHTDRKHGAHCHWLTWLLWMEMAQASLRGSCWRLRWIPPPDLNTQRSGFSTSVTPHRKRTRGCPGVGEQGKEFAYWKHKIYLPGRTNLPARQKMQQKSHMFSSEIETSLIKDCPLMFLMLVDAVQCNLAWQQHCAELFFKAEPIHFETAFSVTP